MPQRRAIPVRLSADRVVGIAMAIAIAVFLGVRLGATLTGSRVFMGMDVLRLSDPYSFPDNHPVHSFYYVTDQIDSMIPSLNELHHRLFSGQWPQWSNLVAGGTPLLGVPSLGVFTPGRILYLLLPTALVPGWSKLVELGFAWIFTFLFVRRLNGSKLAAGLAGTIYPLTGFMIGWNNYPQVAVGAVIPMLFWAAERYLQQSAVRALIPVAVASALLMFGGFPAVAGQAFYAAGLFVIVRVITLHRRDIRQLAIRLIWLGAAVLVGVGVTAFQLLPFARQLSGVNLGYRSTDFFNHTKLGAALTAFLPKSFSSNTLCCTYSPQDINTYIGAVVLFLVLLGVLQAVCGRVQGSTGIYFVAVILAIVVLIWFQGWWTSWMDHLPIFHGNPIGRIRSQLGLPVAVLAAAGFDFLRGLDWNPGWWRRAIPAPRLVGAGVAALTAAFVAACGATLAGRPRGWVSTATIEHDTLAAAVPLAIIAVLAVFARRPGVRTVLLAVVAVAVVGQGFIATSYYWPTAPRSEFYPTDDAIKFLQHNVGDDRIVTTGYTFRVNETAFYGLRTLNGHAFLNPEIKALTLAVDPGALLGPTYTAFSTDITTSLHSPGLDRMGVRYVVASVDDVIPGTPNAVPIPGTTEPVPQTAGSAQMRAGATYSTPISTGALRGVNIPLTATVPAIVTVTVRNASGSVIATDANRVPVGATIVPVPLAAESANASAAPATEQDRVDISVDRPGVSMSTSGDGRPIVQPVRPPTLTDNVRLAYAGNGLVVWERLDYVPRIHWASRAQVVTDAATRLRAVADEPVQSNMVILNAAPPNALPAGPAAAAAQLSVARDDGDQIATKVTASAPGYLVVADSIQQDFVASVDGHASPIVAADYAGGAVYVPAGTHTVLVSYHARGGTAGIAISAASAGLLILAAVPADRLRRRRRREADPGPA